MIETADLVYSDGERALKGIVARDSAKSGRRPGIVVFHEAPGITPHIHRRIKMLAELGYVALAADLFGDGQVMMGPELFVRLKNFQETPGLVRKRVRAAYRALVAQGDVDPARTGATGYCMGGTCALELARSGEALAGVVSFHGVLTTREPAQAGVLKPRILALTGADDPIVPEQDVIAFQKEMTAAKADWQLVTYGGTGHAFTNSDTPPGFREGFAYNPSADRRSWLAMRNFFDEVFA